MLAVSLIHVFCAISLASFILVAALAVYILIISNRRIRSNAKGILDLTKIMDLVIHRLFDDNSSDKTEESEGQNAEILREKTNPLT